MLASLLGSYSRRDGQIVSNGGERDIAEDRFSRISLWLRTCRKLGGQGIVRVRAKIGDRRSGLRGRCVAKGAFKLACNPCVRCVQTPESIFNIRSKLSYRLVFTAVFVAIVTSFLFIVFNLRSLHELCERS